MYFDRKEQVLPSGTSSFGLAALIVSLSVLFLGTLAGYWIVRAHAVEWGRGLPEIPLLCLASTAALGFLSFFSQRSVSCFSSEPLKAFKSLCVASFLGISFLLLQGAAWKEWILGGLPLNSPKMYAFLFYFLTFLHIFWINFKDNHFNDYN